MITFCLISFLNLKTKPTTLQKSITGELIGELKVKLSFSIFEELDIIFKQKEVGKTYNNLFNIK